jgi:hypothetical protein
MSIDFSKPVQTRSGRAVRILCTDRSGGLYPIVGLIEDGHGVEKTHCWTRKGCDVVGEHGSDFDLINVPPPKTKVKVEVRLVQTSDGVEAHAKCDNTTDLWWPHDADDDVIASTTIEMEYEEQP